MLAWVRWVYLKANLPFSTALSHLILIFHGNAKNKLEMVKMCCLYYTVVIVFVLYYMATCFSY